MGMQLTDIASVAKHAMGAFKESADRMGTAAQNMRDISRTVGIPIGDAPPARAFTDAEVLEFVTLARQATDAVADAYDTHLPLALSVNRADDLSDHAFGASLVQPHKTIASVRDDIDRAVDLLMTSQHDASAAGTIAQHAQAARDAAVYALIDATSLSTDAHTVIRRMASA